MYDNKAMCSECGGKCCKRGTGIFHPKDFIENGKFNKEKLKLLLKSTDYMLDYREDPESFGCKSLHFPRPRHVGDGDSLIYATWGGQCRLLTSDGCSLGSEEKPHQCRNLEPKVDGECIEHGRTNFEIAIDWSDYQNIVDEIIKELES